MHYLRNVRLYLLIALLGGLFILFLELAAESKSHYQTYSRQRLERDRQFEMQQPPGEQL